MALMRRFMKFTHSLWSTELKLTKPIRDNSVSQPNPTNRFRARKIFPIDPK
jgi:hypothetical protein